MDQIELLFSNQSITVREVSLVMALLPPPVSLNLLCEITKCSPVEVLQTAETLVKSGYLIHDSKKGAGHYCLSDFKTTIKKLSKISGSILIDTAKKAVAGVCNYLPGNERRWLSLAHIYQISGLPLKHYKEVIKAGHYCLELNLPVDAAAYFCTALESMEEISLDNEGQKIFIDATIGLCTCKGNSLSCVIQRRFLNLALKFSEDHNDLIRIVKIRILIARTYLKTIQSDEAARHMKIVREMMSEHDLPQNLRLKVLLNNSELLFWQGYITKAIESYESVIGSHEKLPSDTETLKSYIQLGMAYGVAGEIARGIGLTKSIRKKAKEINAPMLEKLAVIGHIIILSDSGRIGEAESLLNYIFKAPDELIDIYLLWPGNGKRSYFEFTRGRYKEAFTCLDNACNASKAIKSAHHRGPDNLEIMLGLEEMGMIHPEWQFDPEIKRLLSWPDIYMKGVAYRFRALKAFKKDRNNNEIKEDLNKSIELLTKSGARIELGHSQVMLARILINEKNTTKAKKLLQSAWEVFSKVNPDIFPKELKPYLDQTSKNALWVESLLEVSSALSASKTKEELLGKIIRQAMMIAGAERGAIFLRHDKKLKIAANRNIHCGEISQKVFCEQLKLIEDVFQTGSMIIRAQEDYSSEDFAGDENIGWIGCFPISLKSKVMGVIFMDQRATRIHFSDDEKSLLRIICNQAAVAFENMEVYEEIIDQKSELEAETRFYRQSFDSKPFKNLLIGNSKPFKEMLNLISSVAESDTSVMITGETGVGKDMVAQALHQHSSRSSGPFIAVNVLSLSPELITSELFGHEKGSFTGALQTLKGRFELASNGTLFLDDIDAFPLDIQVKLLRVLETKAFERVGGTRTIKTSFRLLAASNRNIEDLVKKGLFRSDFYYRLNVFPIKVPSLRERIDDIPELADYYLTMFNKKFGKRIKTISAKNMELLMNYSWPGNIRELRHVIERAVLLSKKNQLIIPPLENPLNGTSNEKEIIPLKEMEARYILKALSLCRCRVSGKGGAAQKLKIKPSTLYSKMKRLGINKDDIRFTTIPSKGLE